MPNELVSVIITNYNYARFLSNAIDSALAQTYDPVEVIVVDDGSTDGSEAIIRSYGDRIRAVLQPNGGQASAFNAGYHAAHGTVLCFLDADDIWAPQKIERVIETLRTFPKASWLRHKLEISDAKLSPLRVQAPQFVGTSAIDDVPELYLEQVVGASTSALVLTRSAAEAVLPIPAERTEQFRHDADALLVALLGARRQRGVSLDEALGSYRRHDQQQFVGESDILRMLQRQICVARATSKAWSDELGRESLASSIFKHSLITATLGGSATLSLVRLATLASGLNRVARLAPRSPRLAARQSSALLVAFATPRWWLARLLRAWQFGNAVRAPSAGLQ